MKQGQDSQAMLLLKSGGAGYAVTGGTPGGPGR